MMLRLKYKSLTNIQSLFGLSVLLFLWIYGISFKVAPSASTSRIVFIVMSVCCFRKFYPQLMVYVKQFLPYLSVIFVCTLWSVVLYFFSPNSEPTQMARFFYLLIFVFPSAVLFFILSKHNEVRFAKAFSVATLIQAAFIFYSFLNPSFRQWTADIFTQGGNIPLTNGTRVAGLSNGSGASFSLIQAIGVFCALFVVDVSKNHKETMIWLLFALVIWASTILTGRTGLVVGGGCFGIYGLRWLFGSRIRHKLHVLTAITLVAAIGLAAVYAIAHSGLELNKTLKWAFLWTNPDQARSLHGLESMPIPPLTEKTVLGTGAVVGLHGNASGNDSGYIQTYFATGLLFSFLFYVSTFLFLIFMSRGFKNKFFLLLLIAIIFIVEVKEPFIFKRNEILVAFVFAISAAKYRRKQRQ